MSYKMLFVDVDGGGGGGGGGGRKWWGCSGMELAENIKNVKSMKPADFFQKTYKV